jgi:hypothetical protein
MRVLAYLGAVLTAIAAGSAIALIAIRADWGPWTIYGAIVLAGVLIAGVSTPFMLGPISRHREHPVAGSKHSIRF